jgi:hypothetical protein
LFIAADAYAAHFSWGNDEEILKACATLRQGDVIQAVALAFTASAGNAVTNLAKTAAVGRTGLVGVKSELEYALITSQTCDLRGARGRKYPLVSIAPVYDISEAIDRGSLGNVKQDKVGELVCLDGARWKQDGKVWIADLRFECAIEKGMLVGKQPIRGFSTEDGYLRCARKVARVRSRAAIDDDIDACILRPLAECLRAGSINGRLVQDILLKATPSTVDAHAARLYVLVYNEADREGVQDACDDWHARISPTLPDRFTFLGCEVRSTSAFTWSDYKGCELVDLSFLSIEDNGSA